MIGTGLVAFVLFPVVRRHALVGLRALQLLAPVYESPVGVTVLTRHVDVIGTLRAPTFGSDVTLAAPAQIGGRAVGRALKALGSRRGGQGEHFAALLEGFLLFKDGSEHARLRGAVARAFTPRRVDALAPQVGAIVDELLAGLLRQDRCEFMSGFAYLLPARVICSILGIPEEDRTLFIQHAPALATALDFAPVRAKGALERADRATVELGDYVRRLLDERRRSPTDDLVSELVHAEVEGRPLDDDELVSTILLLVLAGHETTATVLGAGIVRMLRDRRLREELATASEEEVKAIVEELLRLDGPVQIVQRISRPGATVAGRAVPAGRVHVVSLAAANHDPSVFGAPRRLDPHRVAAAHAAFGGGAHFCLGAHLARLELRLALRALARGLPADTRLARRPKSRNSYALRGIESAELRWS